MKREVLQSGSMKLLLAETENPFIIRIVAQIGPFQYRGFYKKRLLGKVYADMTMDYEHFMKTSGKHFSIELAYDLKEAGDGKLAKFVIMIDQDEQGKQLYSDLVGALDRLGIGQDYIDEISQAVPSETGP